MLLSLLLGCQLSAVFAARSKSSGLQRYEQVTKLKRELLSDYDPDTIPAPTNKSVKLETQLSILHMDLTEKGELDFTAWITMKWNDARLAWSTEEYPDVGYFRINADNLWVPDMEIFNAIQYGPGSFSSLIRHKEHKAIVYPSGDVMYLPPVNGKVQCNDKEFADWPWGEYDCNIVLGSWTFEGAKLNTTQFPNANFIRMEKTLDMTGTPVFFTENSFTENPREDAIYDCCPDTAYPKLDYKFKIQRAYRMTENGKEMNPNPKPAYEQPKDELWMEEF